MEGADHEETEKQRKREAETVEEAVLPRVSIQARTVDADPPTSLSKAGAAASPRVDGSSQVGAPGLASPRPPSPAGGKSTSSTPAQYQHGVWHATLCDTLQSKLSRGALTPPGAPPTATPDDRRRPHWRRLADRHHPAVADGRTLRRAAATKARGSPLMDPGSHPRADACGEPDASKHETPRHRDTSVSGCR